MHPLDWTQCPTVESVPGRLGGAWVFPDTRIPVSALFENLEDRLSLDEVVALYEGLTRAQALSVVDFAALNSPPLHPVHRPLRPLPHQR